MKQYAHVWIMGSYYHCITYTYMINGIWHNVEYGISFIIFYQLVTTQHNVLHTLCSIICTSLISCIYNKCIMHLIIMNVNKLYISIEMGHIFQQLSACTTVYHEFMSNWQLTLNYHLIMQNKHIIIIYYLTDVIINSFKTIRNQFIIKRLYFYRLDSFVDN